MERTDDEELQEMLRGVTQKLVPRTRAVSSAFLVELL